jgi:predicted Zn-dependent protease with MMP-like domain
MPPVTGWATDPSGPGMDLLTVVVHELGHVAGLEHDDEGVMQPVLSPRHKDR